MRPIPPVRCRPPCLTSPGVAPYSDFDGNQIGYGSGIAVDPSDPYTFWASNEFANTDPVANWGTWITSFKVGHAGLLEYARGWQHRHRQHAPSDFTLHFSDPIDTSSIHAADFTVNGVSATSFTLVDPATIQYHFKKTPITQQGPRR